MKENGKVIKIENGMATVEITPEKECVKCRSCGMGRPRRMVVDAGMLRGAQEGDHVVVDVAALTMMKVYFLLYGAPLVVFTSLILIVYLISRDPLISFSAACLGTILSYIAVGKYIKNRPDLSPKICPRK